MGVRHLPVFDERQRLCGIITRKDMVLHLPWQYVCDSTCHLLWLYLLWLYLLWLYLLGARAH